MGVVGLLIFCFDSLAWPVFALIYPLWASIRAIETNSNTETHKLITYWISFSVILLFEYAFQRLLDWVPVWPYIKLLIVCCMVVPHFDGSLIVYEHLLRPWLSVDPQTVINQLKELTEVHFKKDKILVEVERYVRENGPEAWENLIALKSKTEKPKLLAEEIKAVAEVNVTNSEEPEVARNDRKAAGIAEKPEVESAKPVRQVEHNLSQAENRTHAQKEMVQETPMAAMASRDIPEVPLYKKVQKEWTCAICQVTTQSEVDLNMHLQGWRHKDALEHLKPANKSTCRDLPVVSPSVNVQKDWTCDKCQVTLKTEADRIAHLEGKRHWAICEKLRLEKQQQQQQQQTWKIKACPASGGEKSDGNSSENIKCEEKEKEKVVVKKDELKTGCVVIRDYKWCCTICNVTCTSEGDLKCHLNGRKHLSMAAASIM